MMQDQQVPHTRFSGRIHITSWPLYIVRLIYIAIAAAADPGPNSIE